MFRPHARICQTGWGKAQKKFFFQPLRPNPPRAQWSSFFIFFARALKKILFLSGPTTKKRTFMRLLISPPSERNLIGSVSLLLHSLNITKICFFSGVIITIKTITKITFENIITFLLCPGVLLGGIQNNKKYFQFKSWKKPGKNIYAICIGK